MHMPGTTSRPILAGVVFLLAAPQILAAARDDLIFDDYAYKGSNVDSVEQEALEAVAAEAVERVYRETDAKTPDQKQARSKTLEEAKRRAKELVKYTVTDGPRKRPGAPGYIVIRATVSPSAIKQIYAAQTSQPGAKRTNYKVMVVMTEEHCVAQPIPGVNRCDYDIRPESKVVRAIEQTLIKNGIKVVNGNMIEEIKKVKVDNGKIDGADAKLIQKLASDKGCHILVTGRAKSDGPSPRDIGTGETYFYWKGDAAVTACHTDSGETIWSDTITGDEAGDRIKFAGREIALEKTGYRLAEKFVAKVADNMPSGQPQEIEVKIANVKTVDQADQIAGWFEEINGKDSVSADLQRGMWTAQVSNRKNMKTMDIARKVSALSRTAQAGFRIEFTDTSPSTLTGRVEVVVPAK